MFASYHVRPARPSERDQIRTLQPETDDTGLIQALLAEPSPDLESLIMAGRYFVATTGNRIVAGAGWAPQDALGDVAVMRAVWTHPEHEATGIGRRLVEITEDAAVTAGYGVILAPVPSGSAGMFETLGYLAAGGVEVEISAGRRLHRRKMWKHAA